MEKKNDKEIAQNYNNINKILSNHNEVDNLNQRNNQLKTNLENAFEQQPIENENNNLELCQICKKNPIIYYLECCHPICSDCFDKYAEKHFYDMKCNICNKRISEEEKKAILKYKYYIYAKIEVTLIECPYPGCGKIEVFKPRNVDYTIIDENKKFLTKQAAEDYAKNSFLCGSCFKTFCIKCGRKPYHLGKTCKEQEEHEKAKNCRFCYKKIKEFNIDPDDEVCN